MRNLEKSLKAVANRRRLVILKYLKKNGEASVGDIASELRISFKATSKHLAILFSADIIDRDQRSLQMFYRLSSVQQSVIRNVISLL